MTEVSLQVFILSYNRPEFLKKCLQSFLAQSYQNIEIIILDNKSDFDVKELVLKFNSPKISIIVNENNIGSFRNFSKAISLASKKYVMIFHDDDCISPNLIQTQLELFNKNQSLGFIVTGVNLISDINQILTFDNLNKKIDYKYYKSKGDILDVYYSDKILGFGSIMYKTDLIKNFPPEPNKYAQVIDRAYMLNLSMVSHFIFLENPNYNALQHDQQDSFNRKWDFNYDLNLMNLYYISSKLSNKTYLNWKISKSTAELYSLRRPLPSLFSTLKKINFNTKIEVIVFLVFIPYYFIRSRFVYVIKKHAPVIYKILVRLKKIFK